MNIYPTTPATLQRCKMRGIMGYNHGEQVRDRVAMALESCSHPGEDFILDIGMLWLRLSEIVHFLSTTWGFIPPGKGNSSWFQANHELSD